MDNLTIEEPQSENQPRVIKVYIIRNQTSYDELGAAKLFKVGDLAKSKGKGLDWLRDSRAATAPTRTISITGTSDFYKSVLKTVAGVQTEMRRKFENQGWRIINFDLSLDGWAGGKAAINIRAEVPNGYYNQQHLDLAYALFNQYELTTGVATFRVFSSLRLDVTGPEMPNYNAPTQTTTSGTPTPNYNYNSNGNNGGNGGNGNGNGGNGGKEWSLTDLLGLGAGVSGATALAVGGIFLLVMIKK